MTKFITLIFGLLLSIAIGASQIVVGPTEGNAFYGDVTGAVFGPSAGPGVGSVLNGLILDVPTNYSEEYQNKAELYVYQLENTDGTLSCTYDETKLKATSLSSGMDRMAIMSSAVPFLQNPTLGSTLVAPELSESVNMFTATQVLGAAQLSSNEVLREERLKTYLSKCEQLVNNSAATGQVQLYSHTCMIYQLVNLLADLDSDSDALAQKAIELNTVLNQAIAENSVREAKIQEQKQKIAEINNELKKAIDKVKKAKEDLKKANDAVETAKVQLTAAQGTPCSKAEDGSEDCSARDEAIAMANKALEDANKKKADAEKQLEKAATALLDLLKTKFNNEATTILALLSGTIKGEVGGKDVNFKVNDKDFTLVDVDDAISSLIKGPSYHGHWGRFQEENPNGTQEDFMALVTEGQQNDYFKTLASHLIDSKNPDKKYYNFWGDPITREQSNSYNTGIFHTTNQEDITNGILDKFSTMGNSAADNLLTIATAVGEYQEYGDQKQLNRLQAMKTPQSRIDEISRKIDQHNQLNKRLRDMYANNICLLDKLLAHYRQSYDLMNLQANSTVKFEPYLVYVYNLSTKPYLLKLKDGYKTTVDLEAILKKFECFAINNDEQICGPIVKNTDLIIKNVLRK